MLTERTQWEQKARLFYQMRHSGLPRLNKPFPTAADGHVAVIDKAIRKNKPFWIGQITSGDKLCVFTALKQQLGPVSDAAADYLDFELNQRSGFIRKMRVCLDYMLLMGRGIIKATVDPFDKYRIVNEPINPLYIIMPQECNGFDDADDFVHVRTFTVESYKRLDDRYDKEPSTIERIRGSPDYQSLGVYNQDVRMREGIAYTRNSNNILIFEHYVKTGGGWTVNTYSPMAPDIQLRKPYGVPYKWQGKVSLPFFSFQMEVKDEGWYSPRGLGELLANWEQYQTKLLNEKADAMTFMNRPILTGEKEITNAANYRFVPGEYMPGNIRSVQFSPPPMSFDGEMQNAKAEAEEIAQAPDFGIVQQGPAGGKARTATENDRISALQQTGSTDNGQIFREDLTKLYCHHWGMICQFKDRDFTYYAANKANTLPEQALHDQYLITPDGSPDGWNRIARFQKAMIGIQSFQGNPNVDPEPLTKEALMAWDGPLALKAFIPTNLKGAGEYADQVIEINALLAPAAGRPSFPAPVKPDQDQAARIKATIDWLKACHDKEVPVDPDQKQRVVEQMAVRFQFLKQQNPDAAKQLQMMLAQMEQAATMGQPPGGMPGNVAPMPGAPPMQQPQQAMSL